MYRNGYSTIKCLLLFKSSKLEEKISEYIRAETRNQNLFLYRDKKPVNSASSIGSFCEGSSCCLTAINPDDKEVIKEYFQVVKSQKETVRYIFDDDQSSDEDFLTNFFENDS